MKISHYLLIVLGGVLAIVWSSVSYVAESTASVKCPITSEVVRSECEIPSTISLEDSPYFDVCGVSIPGTVALHNLNYMLHLEAVDTGTIETTKTNSLKEAMRRVGIYSEVDRQRARYVPERVEVTGVGDAAWYIRHPLFTVDAQRGLRDPGFDFYVAHKGTVAVLRTGGADYAAQKKVDWEKTMNLAEQQNQPYTATGAGCSLEEIKNIANKIALPYIEAVAQEREKEKNRILGAQNRRGEEDRRIEAARQKRLNALIEDQHLLAQKHCPKISQVVTVCGEAGRLTDVQALAFQEKKRALFLDAKSKERPQSVACIYLDSVAKQSEVSAINSEVKGIAWAGPIALRITVTETKNLAEADFLYKWTFKSYVKDNNAIGRDEIGSKSLRTKRSLGFTQPSQTVVLTQDSSKPVCTPDELLELGRLLKK